MTKTKTARKRPQGRPTLPEKDRKVQISIRLSPGVVASVDRIVKTKPYTYKRNHFIEEAVNSAIARHLKE